VARHADPPQAAVDIRTDRDSLVLSVVNPGTRRRAPEVPSGGNGLPGMRERAASVGGTLVAGPRLTGEFSVDARLPLTDVVEGGLP
jgi:signal transduction histidine kinase